MADYTQKAVNFLMSMDDKKIKKSLTKLESQWDETDEAVQDTQDSVGQFEKSATKSMQQVNKKLAATENAVIGVKKSAMQTKEEFEDFPGDIKSFALAQALGNLKGNMESVRSSAGEGTGMEDASESLLGNLLDVNKVLGLSRDELRAFRKDITAIPPELLSIVSINEIGESLEGLVTSGVRTRDSLAAFAPVVSLIAKATGEGFDSMSEDVYKWRSQYGLSLKDISKVMASVHSLGKENAIQFSDMRSALAEYSEEFEYAFRSMSSDSKQRIITSFSAMRAAFAENWSDLAPVMEMATKAMVSITSDEMQKLVAASGMAAMDIQTALKSGNIDIVMKNIMQKAGQYVKNEHSLRAWAETTGIASDALSTMSRNQGDILGRLDKYSKGMYDAANGTQYFTDVVENSTTWGDRLKTRLTNLAAKTVPGLNVSILDIKEALLEVNWLSIWAGYQILSLVISSAGAVGTAIMGIPAAIATAGTAIAGYASTIGGAFTAMLGPIALIVVGVALVSTAIGYLAYKLGYTERIWSAIKKVALDAFTPIQDAVFDVYKSLSKLFGLAGKGSFDFKKMGEIFIDAIIFAVKVTGGFIKVFAWGISFIVRLLEYPIIGIIAIGAAIGKGLIPIIDGLVYAIGGLVKFFMWAWGNIEKATEMSVYMLSNMGDTAKAVFSIMSGWIDTAYNKIVGLGDIFSSVGDGIMLVLTEISKKFMDFLSDPIGYVSEQISSLMDVLGLSDLSSDLKGVLEGVIGFLTAPIETMKKATNTIVDAVNGILDYDLPLIGSLKDITGISIPKFGVGAYVTEPTLALIAERGPEYVLNPEQIPPSQVNVEIASPNIQTAPQIQEVKTELFTTQNTRIEEKKGAKKGGTSNIESKLDILITLFQENLRAVKKTNGTGSADLNKVLEFGV